MLSIGGMASGQESYYVQLAREDYFLAGGEPPGSWAGGGVSRLGLSGKVRSAELRKLFAGYHPRVPTLKLVQNAGKSNRQPGWDLTFSASKSVSVLWSQATPQVARAIQDSQAAAVKAAIEYIENNFAFSRCGKGGVESTPVELVVALFEHSTSRAHDPNLHTHCLVMNCGIDAAGHSRSLVSKTLYQAKMLAGAYYRCQLAYELQSRLNVTLERTADERGKLQDWFEIKEVPSTLRTHFSKRRAEIVAKLEELGLESASDAAVAALTTRRAKSAVPSRSELFARWRSEAVELGISLAAVDCIAERRVIADVQAACREQLNHCVAEATRTENVFTTEEIVLKTLVSLQASGIDAAQAVEAIHQQLPTVNGVIPAGVRNGRQTWTTQEVLGFEQSFLDSVKVLRERKFHPIPEAVVQEAVSRPRGSGVGTFTLDSEQQAAVRYLLQGNAAIKVVTGFAGTGKTDMLAATREALERTGYRVLGTALAGVAARTLFEKAGIPSETIRRREYQLFPKRQGGVGHHLKQLARAAQGKPTRPRSPLLLDEKTVLVIDEAGMVGTRDFSLLLQAVVKQGGAVIVVGDERQLASIDRGGCLADLVKSLGGVRLTEIRRQRDAGDQQAVKDVVAGNAEEALRHYASKGQFYTAPTSDLLERQLVDRWAAHGGADNPGDHRVLVSTRAEVDRFNALLQAERVRRGKVDPLQQVQQGQKRFMVGDQVRFDESNFALGVLKGMRGEIVACKQGFLGDYVAVSVSGCQSTWSQKASEAFRHHAAQLLRAAAGKRTWRIPSRRDIVVIPLVSKRPGQKAYRSLSIDYSMTTHLAQGQTVKNAYVKLGGKMTNRELAYVQMSRHREGLYLFAEEAIAGTQLVEMSVRMTHEQSPPAIEEGPRLAERLNRSELELFASRQVAEQRSLQQRIDR